MYKYKRKSRLGKVINIILTCILILLIVFLLVNVIMSVIDPTHIFDIFGYQFYMVATNSMVPTLPVGSLVISRKINEKTVLKEGDIITFNAQGQINGNKIIVTHYFRKTIIQPDGSVRLETYPEAYKDTGDNDGYYVELSDVRGLYVTHIPWIGKLTMFLKSPPALAMYLTIVLVIGFGCYLIKKGDDNFSIHV